MTGSSGATIEVLYVDGSTRGRDRVAERLAAERPSITVSTADSAASVTTAVTEREIDCIVSRHDLPGDDGLDLLSTVREDDPILPVVLFPERPTPSLARDAVAAGVTEYVPDTGDGSYATLAERIETAVEGYRTEQAHREREQRYRTLVERSHDGIYIYQGDRFRFVNDRVTEITGYDKSSLYEMPIWELVHPEDRDRVRDIGERRRRGEDAPTTYEARLITADGETRYLEFSVQSITYQGEWAALGSVRDATERRRRERQFREEKAFVETLFDTLDDIIFVSTLDGDLRRWNDRMVEVTGYPPERLEDMNVFDLLQGDYGELSAAAVRERIESRPGGLDVTVQTASDETIPFEFRGSTLTDEDGNVTAITGIARDVSDRKEREQELEQYRTIIEAVGDPVYTLDAEGRITLVNEALEEITGYDESELLGEHVSILMRDEDVGTAQRLIERLVKSDEQRNGTFEMEAITKNGDHIPCEDHMALLPGGDGFSGTAGVVRDISNRKERERTLRRQNQRLDQFASVVSHDLRNPLNVIIGRLEHARQTGEDVHFDAIERSARRMERMIDDLLTLARDGKRVGEVEPVSLDVVVDRAWGTVDTGAARLTVEDGLGTVSGDENRLQSLFENLFRNAVEHGSTGPARARQDAVERGPTSDRPEADDAADHGGDGVTVRVGTIETPDTAGFYVADDGTGIPPDEREAIFDHGYSTAEDGTGLGLVIVEGIVQAHGWEIRATEGRHGGARFEVTGVERPGGDR